jgi:hypothetical protein
MAAREREIVKKDWVHSAAALANGGLIVIDDSALGTAYQPPIFAFKGHPGPSEIADKQSKKQFREILQVGHNGVFKKNERR